MSAGNVTWQQIVPANLSSKNAAGNGSWFQLVPLTQLITSNQAKLRWVCIGNTFNISTEGNVTTFTDTFSGFSITSVNNSASDMYLPTGDVIVPVNASGTLTQQIAAVNALNVQVLFVLNSSSYAGTNASAGNPPPAPLCMVIPASLWQHNSVVENQSTQSVVGSFYSPTQRTLNGYTIVGDVLDGNTSLSGSSGFQDTTRVIAAVNSNFVLTLTGNFPTQSNTPPAGPSFNPANNVILLGQLGQAPGYGIAWRSDPYANFASCGGLQKIGQNTDCTNSFVFFDFLTPDVVAACCAGTAGTQFNCGNKNPKVPNAPVYGNASTLRKTFPVTVTPASQACNQFMNAYSGVILQDPNAQAYVATQSGQLDKLVSDFCPQGNNYGLTLCACSRPQQFGANIPAALQTVLQASPQCSVPDCSSAGAYQNGNIAGVPCQFNIQQCLASNTVTNAATGSINQLVSGANVNCVQQIANTLTGSTTGASGTTTGGTNTVGGTIGSGGIGAVPTSPGGANIQNVNIPSTTTTAMPSGTTMTPATAPAPTSSSSSKTSNILIPAVIIGGVVLLVLLLYLLSRSRSSRG